MEDGGGQTREKRVLEQRRLVFHSLRQEKHIVPLFETGQRILPLFETGHRIVPLFETGQPILLPFETGQVYCAGAL